MATVYPLRTPVLGRLAERIRGFLATTVAARNYARNLLLDASTRYPDLDPAARAELGLARRQLADSIAAITTVLTGPAAGNAPAAAPSYVRSASRFARIADTLPASSPVSRPRLALRDLQLLDGALAEAAARAGVRVTDLDTTPADLDTTRPTRTPLPSAADWAQVGPLAVVVEDADDFGRAPERAEPVRDHR